MTEEQLIELLKDFVDFVDKANYERKEMYKGLRDERGGILNCGAVEMNYDLKAFLNYLRSQHD